MPDTERYHATDPATPGAAEPSVQPDPVDIDEVTPDPSTRPGWRTAAASLAALIITQILFVGAQERGNAPQENVLAALLVAHAVTFAAVAVSLHRAGLPVWAGRGRDGRLGRIRAGARVGAWMWAGQALALLGLNQVFDLPDVEQVVDPTSGDVLVAVLSFGLLAVTAPLVEELVFRRVLLESVRRRLKLPAAALLSSGLFAFMHAADGPATVLVTGIAGLLFALVWVRHGATGAVTAHAVFNGITGLLAVLYVA